MRFPLEVFSAMREAWPATKPLGVRLSATDYADGGWDIMDSLAFAPELKDRGCDFLDVSGGGLVPSQRLAVGPGYQVPGQPVSARKCHLGAARITAMSAVAPPGGWRVLVACMRAMLVATAGLRPARDGASAV